MLARGTTFGGTSLAVGTTVEPSWSLLEPPWSLLEPPLSLELPWSLPGASWSLPGASLEPPWSLELPPEPPGASLELPRPSGSIRELHWSILEHPEASLDHLGVSLKHPAASLEHLGASWSMQEHPWSVPGRLGGSKTDFCSILASCLHGFQSNLRRSELDFRCLRRT